jgi:hypothetical protein
VSSASIAYVSMSAYVSIRQHTSAYVSIRQDTPASSASIGSGEKQSRPGGVGIGDGPSSHTGTGTEGDPHLLLLLVGGISGIALAPPSSRVFSFLCVRGGGCSSAWCATWYPIPPARQHTSAYVSIRQHTSAYVSIRQHIRQRTSVSIRHYTSAYAILSDAACPRYEIYLLYLLYEY